MTTPTPLNLHGANFGTNCQRCREQGAIGRGGVGTRVLLTSRVDGTYLQCLRVAVCPTCDIPVQGPACRYDDLPPGLRLVVAEHLKRNGDEAPPSP